MKANNIIVFTDLDSTLLNEDYSYHEANGSLKILKDLKIPLIFNSSKTISEIESLRYELDLNYPVIAENGSVLGIPSTTNKNSLCKLETITYSKMNIKKIINIIHNIRKENGFLFEGFNDWNIGKIMMKTGLNKENALKASKRYMTEPIQWLDNKNKLKKFKEIIGLKGLKCINGGRFKHIMPKNCDKGIGLSKIINFYKKTNPSINLYSIALGDSENDLPMLKISNYPIIIPNIKNSIFLNHKELIISNLQGSAGWNKEIINLLKKLNILNNVGIL